MRTVLLIYSVVFGSLSTQAQTAFPFRIAQAGDAVADLAMSCPGGDWGRAGMEAAVANVRVDDGAPFQVMLYAGPERRTYSVFLGSLSAGDHRLSIEQNREYSAPGTSVTVADVRVRGGVTDPVVLHAPVLYARKNTVGKFSDVPLVIYAERLRENGADYLQYTVIFSNEDGGTSTRALMARWGRTTDIEYVYKVDLATHRAIIQTRSHKDVEFDGRLEDRHPLLIPVTDNNMVAGEVPSAIRYQIAPVLVDLSRHSREQVMDDDPVMYRIAAKELEREGKLRRFGVHDGQKISDPRNYAAVEAHITVAGGGLITLLRRKDESLWRSSALGRIDYSVDRSGWIRTRIELPPGTKAEDIGEIGFTCAVMPDSMKRFPETASCTVDAISKVFLLDSEYRPGPSFWSNPEPFELPAGVIRTFRVR